MPSATAPSLGDLSLEELLSVKVTTVSKKEESLHDAAAAVFVISNEDLRRSGATTVADALRLAPGLQVASIDASNWAISSRGFNSQFANKLLVMIDGRTVYSPFFSGVFWDIQQVMLKDVDRIEVVRGPGSSVWGANAVNGVINVISKSAQDTQGGVIYGGGGGQEAAAGARYGGQLGDAAWYRVYGFHQARDSFSLASGKPGSDDWDLTKAGFRIDARTQDEGQFTLQGDGYQGNLSSDKGEVYGYNMLGKWSQSLADRSRYELQAYFDHTLRDDALSKMATSTADVAFQHSLWLSERVSANWGLSYRHIDTRYRKSNSPAITFFEQSIPLNLYSGFVQVEFQLVPETLAATLGTKVEHNDFTGIEVQPSARIVYKPSVSQTLWAAATRGVNTPSIFGGFEFGSLVVGPPQVGPGNGLFAPTIVGNPDLKSEILRAYELGYRHQPSERLNVDIAAFYNDYDRSIDLTLSGFVPDEPVGAILVQATNATTAASYGGEAVVAFAATDFLRLNASYSLLFSDTRGEPILQGAQYDVNDPTHQIKAGASYDVKPDLYLDLQLRYVDKVRDAPAYTTADARISWTPFPEVELSITGRNLLNRDRVEHRSTLGTPLAKTPRVVSGELKWRF